MNLATLLTHIRAHPDYPTLMRKLRDGEVLLDSLHIPRAVRPALTVALARDLQRPVVFIVPRSDRMLTLAEEIPAWDPGIQLLTFPDPNPVFYELAPWSSQTLRRRITVLASLTEGRQPGRPKQAEANMPLVILAPARAAITRTLSARTFISNSRWLQVGSTFRLDRLLSLLVEVGYAHESIVIQPGQFSRRGGILDLWPPAEPQPVRVEFFGNEITTLRRFDPASQRSSESVSALRVTPAREGLPKSFQPEWDQYLPLEAPLEAPNHDAWLEYFLPWMNPSPSGLLDFLPPDAFVFLFDRAAIEDAINELEEQALTLRQDQVEAGVLPEDFPLPYLTMAELHDTLQELNALDMGHVSGPEGGDIRISDAFRPGPRFGGQLRPLIDHLSDIIRRHERVVMVSRQASRLAELWTQTGSPRSVTERLPEDLMPGELHIMHGALSEGWVLDRSEQIPLHLLTDAEIFGWARPRPRVRPRRVAKAPESAYADLRDGDWVVHVDFGIGRFRGLVERILDGIKREFLMIEYDGGDQLYVPIHQADRITRYIGTDGSPPTLSRLGTQTWEQAKRKVGQAVEEIARDLLQLYAQRQTVVGHAFSEDTPWQEELEASFPYIETEDQIRALQAVKLDMEAQRPMDRLICGDVGYGKTEVALRAAFKAVLDGKQVAMLVPTTVLAQQHFNTFKRRLAAFPVEVEMLSRFRSRQEMEEILQRLISGEIDIVIGTHRLLQRDVDLKDLGLLIIDEEQRFGVTHKEHLKKMRTEVDVLTLTATPIPRTLYLALTGARDISTINTPPEERLPIITHVGPYDPRLIRQAVLREIDRGGQVFFVHNRVQTIETIRKRLERLIPEARFEVAHGQMPETHLASVMDQFTSNEIDVLVSSSIIESGLDIPNANTLIVDRADWFGLAQLYQLRGRVGRGAAQGYAYFFRHPRLRSTEEAYQRLETIAEHSQLGAGYTIAMRDLELRGAGDILGTRQHGHISAVGFHLYTRLLSTAVRRLKARIIKDERPAIDLPLTTEFLPVSIDLPLPSAIPSEYIADRDLRLQLYRRMAEIRTLEAVDSLEAEMSDRFGPLPSEIENLLYQLKIRILAAKAGVEGISMQNGQILLQLPVQEEPRRLPRLGNDVRQSKRGLWLSRQDEDDWTNRLEQ
ncbi:MAG: transcription-repair coupling factor, partial [Anaerolineales bacterium]|nr:transcription-repair coupling factor [Anaerolineales bacterium]